MRGHSWGHGRTRRTKQTAVLTSGRAGRWWHVGKGGQVYAHVLCPPGPKSYLDRPFHVGCLSSPSTVWNCVVKPAPFWDPVRRPLHLLQYVMSRNLNFLSKKVILGPHLPSFPFISPSFRPQVALFWGPLGAVWGYNEGERRAEAEHGRSLI